MKTTLLVAFQAVFAISNLPLRKLEGFIKRTPLVYDGDGGEGTRDLMMYSLRKAMPAAVKMVSHYFDRDPPRRTNLRFKYASVQEVMANLNNSLVSTCPARMFNRNQCTANSTYSDIHVFEDKLVDAVTVVLANNKQRKIVVSYRATITTQNWLDDLNATPVDLPGAPEGAKVHRGIYLNYMATYNKVRASLTKMLNDRRFKEYSVLVTGYSLGGGAANLAMPDLTRLVRSRPDPRFIELITYSAPRSGNPEYAKYLASLKVPVTRFTIANDVVPHLPFRSSGFTHAGQEFHTIQDDQIGPYKIKVCSQEYDEDPNCAWDEADDVTVTRHEYPFGAPFPKEPLY